ncbi:MAG: hypothetical protein ABH878_02955 [bacterium]
MAFKPSRKKKRQYEEVEANLTPVMNLICILIPLILSTAKFVDLALLEYMPPVIQETDAVGAGSEGLGSEEGQLLELRVNVAYQALEVSIFNATSGDHFSSIPAREDGSYDFQQLQAKLIDIKERIIGPPIRSSRELNPQTGVPELVEGYKFADADQIRISAEGNVPLQTIVNLLDVSREYKTSEGVFHPLFPSPALGQFQ